VLRETGLNDFTIDNSSEDRPFEEADSPSAGQDVLRPLCSPNMCYRVLRIRQHS
jgi:hypothetical protein